MNNITIPDEVVEAAARASYDEHRRDYNSTALECNYVPWENEWSELLLSERMQWMAEARAAILAALKAWPGMWPDRFDKVDCLVLPLAENPL